MRLWHNESLFCAPFISSAADSSPTSFFTLLKNRIRSAYFFNNTVRLSIIIGVCTSFFFLGFLLWQSIHCFCRFVEFSVPMDNLRSSFISLSIPLPKHPVNVLKSYIHISVCHSVVITTCKPFQVWSQPRNCSYHCTIVLVRCVIMPPSVTQWPLLATDGFQIFLSFCFCSRAYLTWVAQTYVSMVYCRFDVESAHTGGVISIFWKFYTALISSLSTLIFEAPYASISSLAARLAAKIWDET